MPRTTLDARAAAFSAGFDHGNYGSAYGSTDYESWQDNQNPPAEYGVCQELDHAWMVGCWVGFFSSYSDSEAPADLVIARNDPDTRAMADAAGISLD